MKRNWQKVCEVGRQNKFLMFALAFLNLRKPSAAEQLLLAAFPECFEGGDEGGPVPLSVIRETAAREAAQQSDPDAFEMLSIYGCKPLGIPTMIFATTTEGVKDYGYSRAPENWERRVGAKVEYQGETFGVICLQTDDTIDIVPFHLVAWDL